MKETDRQQSDFRVYYDVVLSEKCCHSKKEISVACQQEIWSLPTEDRGERMKQFTIDALNFHSQRSRDDGKCCRLRYETDVNILLRLNQFWQYLWLHAEGLINSYIADRHKSSAFRQKQTQSRVELH
jgi:hypothetical protein